MQSEGTMSMDELTMPDRHHILDFLQIRLMDEFQSHLNLNSSRNRESAFFKANTKFNHTSNQ